MALNLVFPLPLSIFNTLSFDYLFKYIKENKSENKPQEINQDSIQKFFLDNNFQIISLNLGKILNLKTKIKKNLFKIETPLILDKPLNKTTFSIPFNNLEAITNPFSDKTKTGFLTNITFIGKEKNTPNLFNVSIENNILIGDLIEEMSADEAAVRLQTNNQNNLDILTFLPSGIYNLTFDRRYIATEKFTAPSVDEKGKPIEVINNKSKIDIIVSNKFNSLDLTIPNHNLPLEIENASKLFNSKEFKNQLPLSGFLIPPDFRPVLEEDYRANIELFMTFTLSENENIRLTYSDLKTKDETKLTNFFNFSFLPEGNYNGKIRFNGDRQNIFQMAGLIEKNEN